MLAAAETYGEAITFILRAGIKPNEEIQLAAVSVGGDLIIRHIIKAGIKPSERVQLAAVKKYSWTIRYIIDPDGINNIDAGIRPSKDVQLAAVEQDGNTIQWLFKAGIKPSKEVLAAARANGWDGRRSSRQDES
jgi:hypothetical protein